MVKDGLINLLAGTSVDYKVMVLNLDSLVINHAVMINNRLSSLLLIIRINSLVNQLICHQQCLYILLV